jgi:NAD(P)-dependent dehydrogenase (short-subunit alcohol dehydrogenase family)
MGDCSYNLEGKRCLVTGAARGLGSEIARRFLEAGASVVLSDINIQGVRETARKLDPEGGRAYCLKLDVTDETQVIEAVSKADELLDGIDVLVNAAGILKHLPIDRMSLEDFTSIITVNLVGTFLMCRETVKVMKRIGGGKIVNIASLGGVTGRPGVGVNYAASKAGVIGLSRTLAKEVGKDKIYVNAVNPGPIMTELTRNVPEQTFASWNAGRAVEKNGLPEDVAAAVLFLASDQSDWITGVSLNVNGGIFI